jgi:hypothetical protein
MTPNQWARGGSVAAAGVRVKPVVPFVVDVTNDVEPGGTATVSYRGSTRGTRRTTGAATSI